jgi:hypothetical protein
MNTQSNIFINISFEENIKKYKLSTIDLYFLLSAPFMLLQSLVVLPVKGATLGYILASLSPIILGKEGISLVIKHK